MASRPDDTGIRWDPYEVWRSLVLSDPELLLQPSSRSAGGVRGERASDFAMTIAEFPDDLQDVLFVIAQERGIDGAMDALDRAIRQFYLERKTQRRRGA